MLTAMQTHRRTDDPIGQCRTVGDIAEMIAPRILYLDRPRTYPVCAGWDPAGGGSSQHRRGLSLHIEEKGGGSHARTLCGTEVEVPSDELQQVGVADLAVEQPIVGKCHSCACTKTRGERLKHFDALDNMKEALKAAIVLVLITVLEDYDHGRREVACRDLRDAAKTVLSVMGKVHRVAAMPLPELTKAHSTMEARSLVPHTTGRIVADCHRPSPEAWAGAVGDYRPDREPWVLAKMTVSPLVAFNADLLTWAAYTGTPPCPVALPARLAEGRREFETLTERMDYRRAGDVAATAFRLIKDGSINGRNDHAQDILAIQAAHALQ